MLIKQQKNNGFSLIELLVVISIIAVLSALLMANFMGARERARDAQKISDLGSIKTALRMYYNDNQKYPAILGEVVTEGYMASLPDAVYAYTVSADTDGFVLTVQLEAGAGNDDIDSQTKCGVASPEDGFFAVCAN